MIEIWSIIPTSLASQQSLIFRMLPCALSLLYIYLLNLLCLSNILLTYSLYVVYGLRVLVCYALPIADHLLRFSNNKSLPSNKTTYNIEFIVLQSLKSN